jgi:hypothetical protein
VIGKEWSVSSRGGGGNVTALPSMAGRGVGGDSDGGGGVAGSANGMGSSMVAEGDLGAVGTGGISAILGAGVGAAVGVLGAWARQGDNQASRRAVMTTVA